MGPDEKEHFDLQSQDPPAGNMRPGKRQEEEEENWSENQQEGPIHLSHEQAVGLLTPGSSDLDEHKLSWEGDGETRPAKERIEEKR